MHRSYVTKEWMDSFIDDPYGMGLPKDARARFFSILRVGPHEVVSVFDGCGREVVGRLDHTGSDEAVFLSFDIRREEPVIPQMVLMQAAISEQKITETIKRGCEYGVDGFIFFSAERSDKYCFERLKSRADRLTRVCEDACRQSGRLFIPPIDFLGFDELIPKIKRQNIVAVFGDPGGEMRLSQLLSAGFRDKDLYILVGPEGGFSEREKDMLISNDVHGVRWAPYILRSELSHLAAIAIANASLGRA